MNYLGILCKRNHNYNDTGKSLRYENGNCVECMRLLKASGKYSKSASQYNKQYYIDNKDRILTANKKYLDTHKVKINGYKTKYRINNKDKVKITAKKYREKYKEQINAKVRYKTKTEQGYKINRNISNAIGRSLKGNKNGCHWENIIGYKLKELKKHLEKLFMEGMTFENYGKWHIDHIVPISLFKFESFNDLAFKECWGLANLQPLWAKDNISKGNRFIG